MSARLIVKGLLGHLAKHASCHGLSSRQVLVSEEVLQLGLGPRLPLPGSGNNALLQGGQTQGRLPIPLPTLLLQHGCCCSRLHDMTVRSAVSKNSHAWIYRKLRKFPC